MAPNFAFDGGGNSNAPKYYDTGTNIRMYPKNSVTITASKNIQKVVFTCDEYQGTTYNASGDIYCFTWNRGNWMVRCHDKANQSSKTTTITDTLRIYRCSASQIRIVSIEITYEN